MKMKGRCCLLFCASVGADRLSAAFSPRHLERRKPVGIEFSFSTRSVRHFMTPLDAASTYTGKENTILVAKPLGIVVEEIDAADPSRGVCISQINADSNAASCGTGLCIHDKIVAVNGASCSQESFEVVMNMITSSPGSNVELTLLRTQGRVAVRWPNGVCVAAPVGEYLGNTAIEARYPVPYSCRSGSCGSCEHIARVDGETERRYRPCSARVPEGVETIEFFSQY